MDWFALALLWLGGLFLLCGATAVLFGDLQVATGCGIFALVLGVCGVLAKGASFAGDSVEGYAAKKPKSRRQSLLLGGGALAYFGGAVIYNWGRPMGFVMLAIWLFSAHFFLRFIRANEFESGDLITLQWEGWFHAARVLQSFDGGYLIRLFTDRATERPQSVVPATLFEMEQSGRSKVISLAEDYLQLCEPELVYEGDMTEADFYEIARFYEYSAGVQEYA